MEPRDFSADFLAVEVLHDNARRIVISDRKVMPAP